MDVHLRSTTVCALDAETGEAVTRRFAATPGRGRGVDVGLPRPVARRLRERLPRLRPAKGALRLGVDCVVAAVSKVPRSAADLSSKNDRNDAARMAKAILSHDVTPGMGAVPRDRGAQGPRRRPRRRDREARGGEAAAPGVPSPPRLCLRRHDAGRQPPEVLDVRLPQVARRHTPRRRRSIRALAALRNEVEAADETRGALLAEYRAAVAAGPSRPRSRRSSRSRGAGSRSPPPSRPRSATSRGSAPAGR